MIFTPLPLQGAWLIAPEPHADLRGFFARTWCAREFESRGLDPRVAQTSVSWNTKRGTLRGMHYQVPPHAEVKLVRCVRGTIYDVIIDLRPESPTFLQHAGIELTAENRQAVYVPAGFAHGFQTLVDEVEVFYQMSTAHSPGHARGVRWSDPAFGISWPITPPVILARDDQYADFTPAVLV